MDKDEKGLWLAARIVILLVVVLFTYYGFLNVKPCDIDRAYLSCRLHPFTLGDLIGCILFYGGAAVLAGVPSLFGVELFNQEGSRKWNIITFIALVAGIVLIWNT
jgi:hypothetical protein